MKLRGIWVAIAVICVAGIGVTNYSMKQTATVTGQEAPAAMAEAALDAVPQDLAGAQAFDAADAGENAENGAVEAAKLPDEAAADVLFSMENALGAAGAEDAEAAMQKEAQTETEKAGILAQLAELDAQLEERRKSTSDASANAMKTAAESERKLWETKLQSILEILGQNLSGEDKNTFFTEQRSWVRERESRAVSDSKKQSGSTLEELEYIRSLRDITRERVYELAKRYETILDGTE